jgi:hypothetical protein
MGIEDKGNHIRGEQTSVPPHDHLVEPLAAEHDGGNRAERRSGAVPVTVVMQAELEALQAKAAKLEQRRASDRERFKRWRERHADSYRVSNAARMREARARQRGQGSDDPRG